MTVWGLTLTNVPAGLSNVVAVAGGVSHVLAVVGNGPPIQQVLVTNAALSTNGFSVTIPSQSGRVFRLEYKDHLTTLTGLRCRSLLATELT